MIKNKVLHSSLTILGFPLVPALLNLLFQGDPGFFSILSAPYLAAVFLCAASRGLSSGFLCLAFSAAFALVASSLFPGPFELRAVHAVPWAASVLLVYAFGSIADGFRRKDGKVMARYRELVKRERNLKRLADGLYAVNRTFEDRVTRQRDSFTLLYRQVLSMNALNVHETLRALLDTAALFLSGVKASIWSYDLNEQALRFETATGWEPGANSPESIPVEGTIEGWVFRNGTLFSLRMLLQYEDLRKLDSGRNIITIPVHAGLKSWGILNVEELPFEMYSSYTERLLQIVTGLAEPQIERALEYERIAKADDVDESTGIPLYSQFYRLLESETERARVQSGSLSVFIFEVENYGELVRRFGLSAVKPLMRELAKDLMIFAGSRLGVFSYREDGQLVVLGPNLDYDGASLYCLESLSGIRSKNWKLGDVAVRLDAIVGYASAKAGMYEAEGLIRQAEHLLLLQKV